MEMPEATYVKGFIQVDFPDPLHHRGRPPLLPLLPLLLLPPLLPPFLIDASTKETLTGCFLELASHGIRPFKRGNC